MTTEGYPRSQPAGDVSVRSLIQQVADRVGETQDYDITGGYNRLTAWMEKLSPGPLEVARLPGASHVPSVVDAIRKFAFQTPKKKALLLILELNRSHLVCALCAPREVLYVLRRGDAMITDPDHLWSGKPQLRDRFERAAKEMPRASDSTRMTLAETGREARGFMAAGCRPGWDPTPLVGSHSL